MENFQVRLQFALQHLGLAHITLRPHQSQALQYVFHQKDCIVSVETGAGKSLVFQVAPFLFATDSPVVVVIVPLKALSADLSTSFSASKSISAVDASSDALSTRQQEQLLENNLLGITHVFISPERILQPIWTSALRRLKSRLVAVFVDEAHIVYSWGQPGETAKQVQKDRKAFRSKFSQLFKLRAFIDAPVVALTATDPPVIRKFIIESLGLREPETVSKTFQRGNLHYSVRLMKPGKSHVEEITELLELVQLLTTEPAKCPRSLIFISSSRALFLYQWFMIKLGDHFWEKDQRHVTLQARVAMFFADTRQHIRADVLANLANLDPNNPLKVVICTSALSLGVDTKQITQVIHYGCPQELEEYVQESGRAGREGQLAKVVLLAFRAQLNIKSTSAVSEAMREYIVTQKCRRAFIADYLKPGATPDIQERCCDICDGASAIVPVDEDEDDADYEDEKDEEGEGEGDEAEHVSDDDNYDLEGENDKGAEDDGDDDDDAMEL